MLLHKGKLVNGHSKVLTIVLVCMLLLTVGCQWGVQRKIGETEQRVLNGVYMNGQLMQGMTKAELRNAVQQISQGLERQPKNAKFNEDTGQVIAEEQGRRVNQEQTMESILRADQGTQVEPVYDIVNPDVTAERLKQAQLIGRYTTKVLDDGPGRVQNLRQTAHLVTNSIIAPGKVFSFNETVGEPSPERGFKEAPVMTPNGKEMGIGGGMCQVSSTLYNAVLAAELTIVERHPHSQPVAYVPLGRDATTFTDKDFKFRNTLDRPIVLKALADHDHVTVEIFDLRSR